MIIKFSLFASLRRYGQGAGEINLNTGATVEELLHAAGIPAQEAQVILVNGIGVDKKHILQDGDKVSLFPLIGGG